MKTIRLKYSAKWTIKFDLYAIFETCLLYNKKKKSIQSLSCRTQRTELCKILEKLKEKKKDAWLLSHFIGK